MPPKKKVLPQLSKNRNPAPQASKPAAATSAGKKGKTPAAYDEDSGSEDDSYGSQRRSSERPSPSRNIQLTKKPAPAKP